MAPPNWKRDEKHWETNGMFNKITIHAIVNFKCWSFSNLSPRPSSFFYSLLTHSHGFSTYILRLPKFTSSAHMSASLLSSNLVYLTAYLTSLKGYLKSLLNLTYSEQNPWGSLPITIPLLPNLSHFNKWYLLPLSYFCQKSGNYSKPTLYFMYPNYHQIWMNLSLK